MPCCIDTRNCSISCPKCKNHLTRDTNNSKDGSDLVCFVCGFNKK